MNPRQRRRVESQIRRWLKHVSPTDVASIYSGDEWRRASGKSTSADLVVCCDTKLRSMLRRAEKSNANEYDTEVMEVFSEMIGDAGYYYELKPTHIEIHSMKIENPEKQGGKDEWKSVKERARGAGRKIKAGAKSDMGRGAIGAGTGALLLGPIGAAAGAGIALATKKGEGKGRKKNPTSKIKLNSMMGNLLLDHHKVSEDVEHLATITLRGDSASVDQIRRARNDLLTSAPSASPSDREQREDLAESLTRLLEKKSKGNPYSSIKSDIKRRRLSKASSSAVRASSAADAAGTAKRMSLRKRLAKINPGSYSEQVAHLSDEALDSEHKAISSLISRAKKSPDTSKRMVADLLKIRKSITEEKARRRKSLRPQGRGVSRSANPTRLTKLPPGTKVKRLPPGKAKGAEPLTPYAHEHSEMYERDGSGQKGPYMVPVGVAASYGNRLQGNLGNPGKARLAELRKKMPRGVKLNYEPQYREYRVTYRGSEYFTTDPNDAVGTAKMMVSPKGSSHKSAVSNPRTVGRKKGKFQSLYTPSESDLRLLKKYDAIEALEGLDPRAIEKFISRLSEVDSRREKIPPKDADLDKAAEIYRKRRERHMHIITSPDSSPGDVAKSQRRLDDAERKIVLIAEMRNMEPADLRRYMESRSKGVVVNPDVKSSPSKKKRKSNPSKREIAVPNPVEMKGLKYAGKGRMGAIPTHEYGVTFLKDENGAPYLSGDGSLRYGITLYPVFIDVGDQSKGMGWAYSISDYEMLPGKDPVFYFSESGHDPFKNPKSALAHAKRAFAVIMHASGNIGSDRPIELGYGNVRRLRLASPHMAELHQRDDDPESQKFTAQTMRYLEGKIASKRKANPRHTGRKDGRFTSMYTPTESDIKLLQKHGAFEAIEGMSPKEIELFMERIRMVGDGKRKSNPSKREAHSARVERPRSGKKSKYRDFVAVFTKGKYSDGKGKYTMEIFAPGGDSVGVARSALPYKKALSVFRSATDAHLDLRISMDDALKLSLVRMQQAPFEHPKKNPSLDNIKSSYKVRAQSLAAIVRGNTAYIESLEETMAEHGKSEDIELDIAEMKQLQAEMCRKIRDGSKLAKYGKKVKWDGEKLKKKAGSLPTMTPEEAGAMNAVGELKAFACISEYAEKMGAC